MTNFNTNTFDNSMSFRTYLTKVFTIMAVGLAITSLVAIGTDLFLPTLYKMFGDGFSLFILVSLFVELGIAIYFSARLQTMSKAAAWTCYILYSVLTGVSIGVVITGYTGASVGMAFVSTTILFVCMAIIGHTTHVDLTKFSTLLFAGLIGIIIASVLNTFLFKSTMFDFGITFIGTIIFLALTAYDVQKLQRFYEQGNYDQEIHEKMMIMGAFQLYLDFINLFLRLLRIFGRSSSNSSK